MQTLKNMFFAKFSCKFLAFFHFLPLKTLKMTMLTSVWSAQHPNAGQNIQQTTDYRYLIVIFLIKSYHMMCSTLKNPSESTDYILLNFSPGSTRECFVAYHESAPQLLVEMAFRLAYGVQL